MSEKDYNPFEGMDGNTTPAELLQALMKKAIEDNDMRPIGGVIGMLQKQVEATMQHLGQVMQRLREEVGQTSMIGDVSRLTIALLINILIEKEIITKDEFEKLYKEKVTDTMDAHIKKIQEEQEKMAEEQKKQIEEFAQKASESGEIMDPNSGEVVSDLQEVPEEDETPAEEEAPAEEAPEHPSIDPKQTTEEE